MMIRNLWVGDLALLELAAGQTAAPPDVLEELRVRGHITLARGKPTLTDRGRNRAGRLKACEHDLRKMFTARGKPALTTDGGSVRRLG